MLEEISDLLQFEASPLDLLPKDPPGFHVLSSYWSTNRL
jgi:hypothetical protein